MASHTEAKVVKCSKITHRVKYEIYLSHDTCIFCSIDMYLIILIINKVSLLRTRKTSPSATMRGLPAAPPAARVARLTHPQRSLRSPYPHANRFARPHPPLLAPLALSHPYLKRALQNGLNWPRYIQKMATSGNTLADSNEIGNFRPTSGHSRQNT